jgi:hypothetical protein
VYIRLSILLYFYINKEGFLSTFKDAFFNVFIIENYYKAFKVVELVSINV